jgi:phosphopantothenoylcysteine decarboxylase/phosphopantothenate--cysteine ligase
MPVKKVVLGITGGISAYKSAELIRQMREQGLEVRVILTESAKQFVTSITLQALSGTAVYDSLWDQSLDHAMRHIELAKWADIIVLAPATANCIARLAHGFADDLLSTVCLASQAPIIVAPAMNTVMWHHPATQTNLQRLRERGVFLLEPASGVQACGDEGLGRMQEPQDILSAIRFSGPLLYQDRKITITAGPTQEALDPVRYLSNHSSGKMGYALAEVANEMGAKVMLISGPTQLACPAGVTRIQVKSAQEMLEAAIHHAKDSDIFIGAAAVADYRPEVCETQKIKKKADELVVRFVKNPDIIAELALLKNKARQSLYIVGFCAETEDLLTHAREKKLRKNLDMIIANWVNQDNSGFYVDSNQGWMITDDKTIELPLMSKKQMAKKILNEILVKNKYSSAEKNEIT